MVFIGKTGRFGEKYDDPTGTSEEKQKEERKTGVEQGRRQSHEARKVGRDTGWAHGTGHAGDAQRIYLRKGSIGGKGHVYTTQTKINQPSQAKTCSFLMKI